MSSRPKARFCAVAERPLYFACSGNAASHYRGITLMAYWIEIDAPARLAIAPRPRGGDWLDDDLQALRRESVDILVSLLTPEEATELALDDEGAACTRAGVEFRNFPIPDRHVPRSTQAFREFISLLHQERTKGRNIAVHCRAGIGRSSLLLASLLTLDGHTAEDAFRRISQARGLKVPDTAEQVEWVHQFRA